MVRRTLVTFVLFAFAALSAMVIAPTSSAEQRADIDREPAAAVAAPVSVGDIPDVEGAVADSVAAFYADVQRQIDEYLAAVEAERLAELARAAAAAARPTSGYHPGATVGECTGFAIPDYIIQRESGGNPSAYNPSGAYGCAQTLLSHYSGGGTCAGLDPYTIEGQRECVWRLSNGGSNLAPWAATR